MPYIKTEEKVTLMTPGKFAENPGQLNYKLTAICKDYFDRKGGRYQQINDVLGALEGCKLEFYRRLAAPYEDKKIVENGDVY